MSGMDPGAGGHDPPVPAYIAARIRQDPPQDCRVVAGSTPVVAFGDVQRARVATLGLNPSRIEFEVKGSELDGAKRRFETTRSLGLSTLADASDDAVAAIFRRCNEYFRGNPYRRWFNRLEPVVRSVGASYYDGTACHLDLSQWSTDPTWNGLSREVRAKLVERDGPFLARQLAAEHIEILLLNGASVIESFRWMLGASLELEAETVADRTVTTRLWTGSYNGIRVIGWSTNLPSSRGVTKQLVSSLGDRVALLSKTAQRGI